MTLRGYDAWLQPPDPIEATDDPGTQCLGHYPETATDDAFDCEVRSECALCGGPVCAEHDDDSTECDGGRVHLSCHNEGCRSQECADDARDDALLARDEEARGR